MKPTTSFLVNGCRLTYRAIMIMALWGVVASTTGRSLYADLLNFRSVDGSGNNAVNPSWGAADTQIVRINYEAFYPDAAGVVTEKESGLTMQVPALPNARLISNKVSAQSESKPNARGLSDFIWQWGQFITHDMDLTPNGSGNNTDDEVVSIPIPVPPVDQPADPFDPMRTGNVVIPFNRSDFDSATGTANGNPREQINKVTSFIDASNVYGSNVDRANSLRSFQDGKLKMNSTHPGLLVLNNDPDVSKRQPNDNNGMFGDEQLFLAGDVRANEQPGLTAMHAVFANEHNRLADLIGTKFTNLPADPTERDERIYQLARKIVGAEMQVVTYGEFLPALLGDFAPRAESFGYQSELDASITQTFSHALFRFGHSMSTSELQLVNQDGSTEDSLELRDGFFNPSFLKDDSENLDRVLRGLSSQLAEENDLQFVDEIRDFLFGPPGAGGLDLMALDIQRGRDHGLPSYNETRRSYLLSEVLNVTDITASEDVRALLVEAYGLIAPEDLQSEDMVDPNIENIDLIVGALAEDHLNGTSVGELVLTVVADQFARLRDGDRFYFLNRDPLNGPGLYNLQAQLDPDIAMLFADDGITDLRDIQLSDIIQWNTSISGLQDNVFFVPEPAAGLILSLGVSLVVVRRRNLRKGE